MRFGSVTITGLASDSRKVLPGDLFFALPGTRVDGSAYMAEAVRRGAVAVLARPDARAAVPEAVAFLPHPDPQRALAQVARRFFGEGPAVRVAVTGTNGKTSVADMTRQIFTLLGARAASLGTLGVIAPGGRTDLGMTSPDTLTFQRTLHDLASDGVSHLAFEASSHGLHQHRVDGARVRCAAFTNLTHDHLDYHGTMEAYLAAKARLFCELLADGGTAVVNADDPCAAVFASIAWTRGLPVLSVGTAGESLRLTERRIDGEGQVLTIVQEGRTFDVRLPLMGAFQASNALVAAALAMGTGAVAEQVLPLLARLQGVPGRLERAATTRSGAPVIVDYAHTPDGLRAALEALRPHAANRLILVFGCGGDRDAAKRPVMGEIAQRMADVVIVTDDNPRSEDAARIRRAILDKAPDAREIGDRREAIGAAMAQAGAGDVVLLAGKGHESGQIVGNTVHPFDDRAVARAFAEGTGA